MTASLACHLSQDVKCAVVGVPKSIDNDILLIDKCFGFDTAVEEAQRALLAAKVGSFPEAGQLLPCDMWPVLFRPFSANCACSLFKGPCAHAEKNWGMQLSTCQ